ncbi:hypothetical protein D3C86_1509240 [compost metagenome]
MSTLKAKPLLVKPFTVTTASPVVAPLGTTSLIVSSSRRFALTAIAPLKLTWKVSPVLVPKFSPVIVTSAPGPALLGVTESTLGWATDSSSTGTTVLVRERTSTPAADARPRPALTATRLKLPTATLERVKLPSASALAT